MNLINWLADFSRDHCVSICAFLVPTILVATTALLALLYLRRPRQWQYLAYGAVLVSGGLMALHVASWFTIGIITPVTFILLGLALSCIILATVIYFFPPSLPLGLGKLKFSLGLKV